MQTLTSKNIAIPETKIPLLHSAALSLLSAVFKTLNLTLRVSASEESRKILSRPGSSILLIWYNRIAFTPYIKTRFRGKYPIYGLVSQSKDGTFLSKFFSKFGIDTERGSSSNGGARASIRLIRHLRDGKDICITPDGPRGPKYESKEGVSAIFEKSGARLLIMRADFEKSWTLKSWDGFQIPKPFSRVRLSAEEFMSPEEFRQRGEEENLGFCELLNQRLSVPA